jgi:signal transduction histidine kinase
MFAADSVLTGSYNYATVLLSLLIAVIASYSALRLAERVNATRGWAVLPWLLGGATALGISMWSMHYTGMLAFRLPIPMMYDWPTSLLSLLAATGGSLIGLLFVRPERLGWSRALAGSMFVGSGIVGLHYIGMESMRLSAECIYDSRLVALSVVFAIGFSLLSLRLTFLFRHDSGHRFKRVGSALLMGTAISAMHYTAMAAVHFRPLAVAPDLSHAVDISVLGVAGVGIATVMMIEISVLTSLVDRLNLRTMQLETTGKQLRALAARLESAKEEEAIRIAREIHDELGSDLTKLKWDLELIKKEHLGPHGKDEMEKLGQKIDEMAEMVDATMDTVRRISAELRPNALDDLGLAAAIRLQTRQFQDRTGIVTDCDCFIDDLGLNQQQSTTVFRVFEEALTNVMRHAGATTVDVMLEKDNGDLVLTIRDNGRGITEAERLDPLSLGLLGMSERVKLIGGEIDITGTEGEGTVVTIRIQIPPMP